MSSIAHYLVHHLTGYGWYALGRYAGILLVITALRLRRHLPHRHTGYVAVAGYVHACSTCGKLPRGATHTGYNGMPGYEPPAWASYSGINHNVRALAGREEQS